LPVGILHYRSVCLFNLLIGSSLQHNTGEDDLRQNQNYMACCEKLLPIRKISRDYAPEHGNAALLLRQSLWHLGRFLFCRMGSCLAFFKGQTPL